MRTINLATALGCLIIPLFLSQPAAAQDGLADIKAAGKIKVGTKADYAPFGFKDASGAIVGLEADLASDVATRLGVPLELVPVVSANRMEFLRQGKIDLMIATMSFQPARDEVVEIIRPFYYASEENVLAPKSAGLKEWKDLAGKPVCGVAGAYYNADVGAVGGKVVALKDVTEALAALKEGRCIAFANDSTMIGNKLTLPEWADYEMPLPSQKPEPWGIAVKKGDTKFRDFMSGVITEWHKTGKLLELEKKWGMKPSPFLVEQQAKAKG